MPSQTRRDHWAVTSEGSRCHSAFRNWAYGEPNDAYSHEDCALIGYHGRSNWIDVKWAPHRAAAARAMRA